MMTENNRPILYFVANLIIVNIIMLGVLNLRYPLVGHDYTLTIPSMLDTVLHFRLNGPSIQWFTPTFGGGIPAFPDPNNGQFSLVILLAMFLPPWTAIMVSIVLYVSAGFIASNYFFRRILKLDWPASLLGASFFSANGFVITRMAAGQLGYSTFTLLPVFLIIMFNQNLPVGIAVALTGLLLAMYIHSAGYFIIIIFCLSAIILFPMLFLYQPELLNWKRLISILGVGGVIGIVISVSKLTATYSFMRYFPRSIADNYPTSFLAGFLGILFQLLGTQSLVPLFILGGLDPSTYPDYSRGVTGTNYGMWELDSSITPVIFIILLVCLIKFIHNPRKYTNLLTNNQQKIALFLLALSTYLVIEFILAKGFIYPALRHLPILSSLRGNVRFTGAFIFPLAFLAATVYQHWSKAWDRKKILSTFLLVNLCTVIPLGSYFLFDQDMYWMFYDIAQPQKIYNEIQAGKSFDITIIGAPPGKNTGALLYRTSNLNVYAPIFGFQYEYYHPQVKSGSIWDISDGYYNMTDPTGFVYPDLNHNKPFDRFRVADKTTMELFAKHIQPNWKIPTYQKVLDWVSGIAFFLALSYIAIQIGFNQRNKQAP